MVNKRTRVKVRRTGFFLVPDFASTAHMIQGQSLDAAFADVVNHDVFEASAEGVQERLHETSEARALLDNEQIPPLGSGPEIEEALDRARRGGLLACTRRCSPPA